MTFLVILMPIYHFEINTIAISKYPDEASKKDLKYLDDVKRIVQKHVSNVIEIIENPAMKRIMRLKVQKDSM